MLHRKPLKVDNSVPLAMENTPTAIATLIPQDQSPGFCLDYFNAAFCRLAALPGLQAGTLLDEIGLFDHKKIRNLLRQVQREQKAGALQVQHRQQAISLVLEMSIVPVEGMLVVSIHDVTRLAHGQEMLEQQTTLMDEHTRSLEAVRASLEAEIARRTELEDTLRRLADTDMLSGLANRRYFMERAAAEHRRSRRYGHELSLVMMDLDKFKNINDTHGHGAGDTVIMATGQICESLSRNGVDIAGRIGGEEFAILLPETDRQGAQKFAERLRKVIETTPIIADTTKIMITASMGVATLRDDDHDISKVLKRADEALYQSKGAGRNMVSVG